MAFEIEQILDKIRKDNNIGQDYKAYKVNPEVWIKFVNKAKPTYKDIEIYDKLDIQSTYGYVKTKDFTMAKVEDYDNGGDIIILFVKDINVFYKKYFYKKPLKRIKRIIGTGTYKIVNTMFGKDFELIDFSKEDTPILNDSIKEDLIREINAFLNKEKIYRDMNITYKRGILLHGEAGNGKTCFIKNIAHELKDKAITIITENIESELRFIEQFLADDDYNNKLKIIVFEDIDGFDSHFRSNILNFLDGTNKMNRVLFIATTNFPDKLDIAIKNRPSRFDDIKHIGLPNANTRKKLLMRYFDKENNKILNQAVVKSEGLSGSHFKEVFILSKLNDWDLIKTIKEVKRRFKQFD